MIAAAPFDRVAAQYDADFTTTRLGRVLRARVWKYLDFAAGQHVLELGCGTGEDALWLAQRGVSVLATDISEGMLAQARAKAAGHPLLTFQRHDANALSLTEQFDGAFANFGVLNCVADISRLGLELARLLRPGGRFVAVVMPPFCLWETLWHALHGDLAGAARRWQSGRLATVGGAPLAVWYPSAARLTRELRPWFALRHLEGLGTLLPPTGLGRSGTGWAEALDRRMPLGHMWADHYIAVLERR